MKRYLWLALLLFLALLLGRAGMPDWHEGPEQYLADTPLSGYRFSAVLQAFGESSQALLGKSAWAFRFPMLLLAMGLLLLLSELGRILFGESRKNLQLAVFMSSVWSLFAFSQMGGDAWLLAALAGYGLTAVLYLKRPSAPLLVENILFLSLALWIAWLPALLGSMAFWLVLRFFHPFGKRLSGLYSSLLWLPALAAGASGYLFYEPELFLMAFPQQGQWSELSSGLSAFTAWAEMKPGVYLLLQVLALLPWLGFLAAGLYEMVLNLRKREEMSLLAAAFLLGGLFSFSLLPQWAFAILIARQLEGYVKKNYPYGNLVKGFAILQLVISFALVFVLVFFGTLSGTATYGKFALKGLLLWVPAVAGIVGLLMKRPVLYIGGPLVAAFAGWLLFL